MPYLVLIIGLLVGLYALYRFLIKASPAQVRTLFRMILLTLYALVLLFFALTGRILVALALLVIAIPFAIQYYKNKK